MKKGSTYIQTKAEALRFRPFTMEGFCLSVSKCFQPYDLNIFSTRKDKIGLSRGYVWLRSNDYLDRCKTVEKHTDCFIILMSTTQTIINTIKCLTSTNYKLDFIGNQKHDKTKTHMIKFIIIPNVNKKMRNITNEITSVLQGICFPLHIVIKTGALFISAFHESRKQRILIS